MVYSECYIIFYKTSGKRPDVSLSRTDCPYVGEPVWEMSVEPRASLGVCIPTGIQSNINYRVFVFIAQ